MTDHIKILHTEVLSDNWYTLRKITYEYLQSDGPPAVADELLLPSPTTPKA